MGSLTACLAKAGKVFARADRDRILELSRSYREAGDDAATAAKRAVTDVMAADPPRLPVADAIAQLQKMSEGFPPEVAARLKDLFKPEAAAAPQPAPAPKPVPSDARSAASRVGTSEELRALAEQNGIDPTTGAFAEELEIQQLRAEGRLSEEDVATLSQADDDLVRGEAYGDALRAAMTCVMAA